MNSIFGSHYLFVVKTKLMYISSYRTNRKFLNHKVYLSKENHNVK